MKKNILTLIICTVMISNNALAQATAACTDVIVTTISAGTRLGAIVRVDNPNCGRSGWFCVEPNESIGLTQDISDKVYAAALSAKATGDVVNVELRSERGCGDFPYVQDFRVF